MKSDQTNHGQVGESEYNGKKMYSARASKNDRQGATKYRRKHVGAAWDGIKNKVAASNLIFCGYRGE